MKHEHDERCALHTHSFDDYMAAVARNVADHGQHIVGVLSDGQAPHFTYTVGLFPVLGFELVVFGLSHEVAQVVLNDIGTRARAGEAMGLNVPDERFFNLPVKLIACGPKAQEVNGVACRFYARDEVPMVQIVLCDPSGLFPGDAGFDYEFMSERQPLL